MKKYLVLSVALLLVACASLEKTSADLNAKWAGRSYDEFIMDHGVSKASQKLQNGMTMYKWEQEGSDGAHCALDILADANNNIASIKASGDPDLCP